MRSLISLRGWFGPAALSAVIGSGSACALDGDKPLGLATNNGWSAFELLTQGDDLTGLADAVYGTTMTRAKFDGLGARVAGDTFRVILNHETTPASISAVDLDLAALKQAVAATLAGDAGAFPATTVTAVGFAYDTVFDGAYHAQTRPNPAAQDAAAVDAYANDNFARFCSGTIYDPLSFGGGRGFADEIYITGEEIDDGRLYALDTKTDTFWEVSDVGLGSWENAALVDTGLDTHVGLVLSDDSSSAPIRLYVGEKNVDANNDGEIDFLERNGLRGGTVYYFDPDPGFSTTDLPDGQVTGRWSPSTAGALFEGKLEDIHTSPFDGTELVFADQNDGVYRMSLDLVFNGDAFDPSASAVVIDQIDDDDVGPLSAPDNVVWAGNNMIYVQEDGSGDQIFEMNPDGSGLLEIADAASEPSGVIDVSELLGYAPGGVLLTSLQNSSTSPSQLGVLIAPDAELTGGVPGDYDGDGFVGQGDLNLVLLNWGATQLPTGFNESALGNGSFDGRIGQNELNGVLLNWGNGSP
ncbi:MAG: hypothetical protein AAF333_05255 [Planctomycetota bacterium]